MCADVIQVNYEQLAEVAQVFQQQAERVDKLFRHLDQQVQQLCSNGWEGPSATRFKQNMEQEILPGVVRLRDAMHKGHDTTRQIIAVMSDADDEAASYFRHLNTAEYSSKIGKSFSNITMQPKNGSLFVKGANDGSTDIHPSDAKQGNIGDCYFISSLATIAQQNPDLIRNAIRDNGDGTYTVTFYEEEKLLGILPTGKFKPVQVTVDNEFPVGDYTHPKTGKVYQNLDATAATDDSGELWTLVYEKAYAKFHNENVIAGYSEIIGGQREVALEHLTGHKSIERDPDDFSLKELDRMHREGYGMTIGTGGIDPSDARLKEKHAYYITDVNVSTGEVTVRNPWGWNETAPITIKYDDLKDNFGSISVNPLK